MASLCGDASLGGQRGSLNVEFLALSIKVNYNRYIETVMAVTPSVNGFARIKITARVRILMMIALALAGILLLSSLTFISARLHAYLSSLPLAMAGIGYAFLQVCMRPARGTLLKRLLLAATFVIWAVDQLLPSGQFATFIGDVVIAAYVLDLYWLVQEQVSVVNPTADCDDRST